VRPYTQIPGIVRRTAADQLLSYCACYATCWCPACRYGEGMEGGVDANVDPELALVLRVSLEEERARQNAAAAATAAAAAREGVLWRLSEQSAVFRCAVVHGLPPVTPRRTLCFHQQSEAQVAALPTHPAVEV
jgi:hypothetical protein